MDRIIKLSELEAAVAEAYDTVKALPDEGQTDPRVPDADKNAFGIAVVLTDGTVSTKGDARTSAPLGGIGRVPTALTLLQQAGSAEQLVQKVGCGCQCGCAKNAPKTHLGVSRKLLRAISAIQPQGDADGKWDILDTLLNSLTATPATFDDRLYKATLDEISTNNVENRLAEEGFTLFDDAAVALPLYAKLNAMRLDALQLATMGATIAADGINPVSRQEVFDGTLSQAVTAMMAVKGPHKRSLPWLITTGIPARSSFGGTIMGVLPGVMGIAAYSPLVDDKGVSIRAAKAVAAIARKLNISALGSARITIER